MKRLALWAIIIVGSLIFLSVVAVILYDVVVFLPYRSEIHTIIQSSSPLYHEPPLELREIVQFIEGASGMKNWVVRMLLIQFERNQHRNVIWHLENALWSGLMTLHFSDEDVFVLWCCFAPYKEGMGLNESANFYYRRHLDQLHIEELVAVVARVRAPLYYSQHPEQFEKRLRKILADYRIHRRRQLQTSLLITE